MSFTEEEQEAISRYIDNLNKTLQYQTTLLETILAAQLPKDKFKKARHNARVVVWPDVYGEDADA